MTEKGKNAYITGGASGIAKAVAETLAKKGVNVLIADRDEAGAKNVSSYLTETYGVKSAFYKVDVSDWDSQLQAFQKASSKSRIHYVFPIAGIGERAWTKNDPTLSADEYEKPDLTVLDVDLTGVLYTSSLAIQHFRRQKLDEFGSRGKSTVVTVASICGLYAVPTLPIYTTAKHGVVGFVRTYGQYLPGEGITLNAVCPNIVRTNIANPEFYAKMDENGLFTPIEDVVNALEGFLSSDQRSGECIEVGPRGSRSTEPLDPMNTETKYLLEVLNERGRPLHAPKTQN